MRTGRRFFLSAVVAALAETRVVLAGGQGQRPDNRPPVTQVPDASNSGGVEDSPLSTRGNQKRLLKEQQKDLRRDVDRLLQMVQELKEESDKTPETQVLSLSLVKRTEDIEKLARTIRDRIRAS
jgi:peptidoglycan hydrolase CwlO-like protein